MALRYNRLPWEMGDAPEVELYREAELIAVEDEIIERKQAMRGQKFMPGVWHRPDSMFEDS